MRYISPVITDNNNTICNLMRNEYMKATGIVRRIDDLGRVVIPKEIRRTMRIREGDPSRIHIDTNILLKAFNGLVERYKNLKNAE